MKQIIETKDGKAFMGIEIGKRGGNTVWYTARADGQSAPSDRALWCKTKKEALKNTGAANVSYGV